MKSLTPKRITWRFTVIIAGLLGLIMFQNCSGFSAHQLDSSIRSFSAVDLETKAIWSFNKLAVNTKDVILYVNPTLFGPEASYGWFYELNGAPMGCSSEQYSDFPNSVQLNCSSPGVLHVTLIVVEPNWKTETIKINLEIKAISAVTQTADEDLFLQPHEIVMNFDGSPGPAYQDPDANPEPTEMTGAKLYEKHCQGCHSPLLSSTKRGKSISQINNAIITYTEMKFLSGLTNAEIEKIADALK